MCGSYEKEEIFDYFKIKTYSSQHIHVLQQTNSLE